MIVVDTSVWIDWFQNTSTPQVETLNNIRDLTDVIIGDMILLEILQGERNDNMAAIIHSRLSPRIGVHTDTRTRSESRGQL